MKNLKRVLSLALATVMVIGMMVVGANAAFSDQADIKYDTAVDTLVALGVINGMGDNTFAPNGTVTRAQAAKMVAYVKAGANETIIGYYTGTTKFTDVTAAHSWATGSINYCVSTGIIAGRSEKSYDPDGTVTGAELSKMLLVALGYKAENKTASETLTGAAWQVNAIRMAQEAGLYNGLDSAFSATRAATRQEAAQIIYNALNTNTKIVNSALDGHYTYTNGGKLIATAFKAVVSTTATDDFGRPATSYTINGKTVKVVDSAVSSFNTAMKEQELFNAIGADGITGAYAKYIVMDKIYVDGNLKAQAKESSTVGQYEADTSLSGRDASLDNTVVIAKGDASNIAGMGNGVLVELFASTDASGNVVPNHYVMVIRNQYLAKVGTATKADANKGTNRSVAMTVYTVGDKSFESDTLQKDDYVIVTLAKGAVMSAVKANTVTGVITATSDTTVKVGSTTYTKNQNFVAADAADWTSTFTFFLDTNGNVIRQVVKEAAVSTDYVYVVKTQYKSAGADLLTAASEAAKAEVIFTDGTHAVVDLAITNAGTATAPDYRVAAPTADGTVATGDAAKLTTLATTESGKVNVGNWFAYTKNENGAYTMSKVENDYAYVATSGVTLSANTTQAINGKYTASTTKVTSIDTNYAATTTTGLKIAETSLTGKVLVTYAKDATTLTAIYAVNQAAATTNVTYAYAVKQGNTVKAGTEWTFAVNGKQETYVISGDTAPAAGKIYTLTSAANDTYTVAEVTTADNTVVTTGVTVNVVDATQFVGTKGETVAIYTYGTTYGVYNVDADHATVVGETDKVEAKDVVTVITVDSKVAAVFITNAFEG